MPLWTAVAQGDPIAASPGELLAVVASVKASHSADDLHAFAQKRGIVLTDYAEEGQRPGLGPDPRAPGYRYVAAAGNVTQAVSLPWEPPWPLSMVDDSQVVEAWIGTPGGGPAPAPAPPTPPRPPPAVAGGGVALAGFTLAGLGLWWHARRRRRVAR